MQRTERACHLSDILLRRVELSLHKLINKTAHHRFHLRSSLHLTLPQLTLQTNLLLYVLLQQLAAGERPQGSQLRFVAHLRVAQQLLGYRYTVNQAFVL